jgi:predicted Zn-dependent protease
MKAWLGLVLCACGCAQVVDQAKWDALADQLRRSGEPVEGDVQAYVRRVASRVAAGEKWSIEVIGGGLGEGMFAAWVPGHVFVPARSLQSAKSEAELAALLAHAMSHRIAPGLGIPAAGEGVNLSEEIRADQGAVARMVKAGYHPQALWDYLERVVRVVPVERLRAVEAAVREAPSRPEWIEDTSEFAEMRARVAGPARPQRAPSLYRYSK